jgi:hypothetical protein
MFASVSEECSDFIVKVKDGGSTFLWNVGNSYQTTLHHIRGESNLHSPHREEISSRILKWFSDRYVERLWTRFNWNWVASSEKSNNSSSSIKAVNVFGQLSDYTYISTSRAGQLVAFLLSSVIIRLPILVSCFSVRYRHPFQSRLLLACLVSKNLLPSSPWSSKNFLTFFLFKIFVIA